MLPVNSTREDNSVIGPLWQRIPGEHDAVAFRYPTTRIPLPMSLTPGCPRPSGRVPDGSCGGRARGLAVTGAGRAFPVALGQVTRYAARRGRSRRGRYRAERVGAGP